MYDIAWMVVRMLLADADRWPPPDPPGSRRPPARAGSRRPPDPAGSLPAPEFSEMALALQNRLLARLRHGEITAEQYRRAIAALAAADDRR